MSAIAFVTAIAGMLALMLAMPRHHRELFHSQPTRRQQTLYRLLGVTLLIVCVISNLRAARIDVGLVVAAMQIMTAGVLTGLALGWLNSRRRAVR